MTIRSGLARLNAADACGPAALLCVVLCLADASSLAIAESANAQLLPQKDVQQYCGSVAASSESIRLDRRRKQLAELQREIMARLAALDAKQNELRAVLDRLEAFERKTSDALAAVYSRMKPDVAAAQLAQLDDDVAAALMLRLKAKVSSAILGEMDASHGAALARKIAAMRDMTDGKNP